MKWFFKKLVLILEGVQSIPKKFYCHTQRGLNFIIDFGAILPHVKVYTILKENKAAFI